MNEVVSLAPIEEPFDQGEVEALLMELDGDVTRAAKRMGVDAAALRAYVRGNAALRAAIEETLEQGVDQAIAVLYEGLRDQGSFQNRYYSAKEFLRSEVGRRRGFGLREPGGASLEVKTGAGSTNLITIRWLDPRDEPGPRIESGDDPGTGDAHERPSIEGRSEE